MQKKQFFTKTIIFGLLAFYCNVYTMQNLDESPYFNTKFLAQYDRVSEQLKKDGFQEVYFNSADNIKLNGLLRTHPNAQATVVLLAGWWPGRKEGIAAIVPMLDDQQYNILLVDVRNHGKSDGNSVWWHLGEMGIHEYKDVIGAINYANKKTNKPIIIWGTCAGAFHAARAIAHLEQQKQIENYNVRGLIFDSGWASILQAIRETPEAIIKKNISLEPLLYATLSIFCTLRWLLVDRSISQHEPETNLYDKVSLISVPVFYIHARNDTRAHFEHVYDLYQKTPQKQCWWIEKSTHACNHLKFKYEYRDKMIQFCKSIT